MISILVFYAYSRKETTFPSKQTSTKTETTFLSSNQNFSLTLPNSYNLKQFETKSNYILELKNENNFNIFVSEENSIPNINFVDLVNADIQSYVSQFENSSNISNVSEFDRGGNPAYTYSLHYLDPNTKTAFYLQTIWLEFNNKYYIIDIEFPLNSLNENSSIINDILNAIVIK